MLKNKLKEIKKNKKEQLITEYVETGEGNGISIVPLNEKEIDIDSNKILIIED